MRVLVLSTWFPYPPDNGAKIRAYHLIRALSERHAVTLAAFRPASTAEAARPDRVEVIPVVDDPFRHVNKPQIVKYASPIPLAFWPSRAMRDTIRQSTASRCFDAVVAIQTPVARYAASIPDVPRVIDVDTSFSYQLKQRCVHSLGDGARLRAWISWQKTHRYERRVFRVFQSWAVVSSLEVHFVAAMVKNQGGGVEIIRNGVECERFQLGRYPVQPNALVYNGSLTYSANYDAMRFFLSEVYPRLRSQLPGVSLTITGSTAGIDRSNLQLDESIRFSGYVEDIRPVVGGSAACVVPIREGSGTRLKILEAMALGVPVISTSKGAEGLDVVDHQHLLLADSPDEFVTKTKAVLQDAALRERLILAARQLVKRHYDWPSIGQQFVELVESTVDRRGRG